jgi:photosystem II stability/assembly factor-like uncharacterized protein
MEAEMTQDIRADEVIQQAKHKRTFIQFGGSRPDAKIAYAGQDSQYVSVKAVKNPELGGVDPVWVPDPRFTGKYRLVGRLIVPPKLPTVDLLFREKHGAIPRALLRNGPISIYEQTGTAPDLSDFASGWNDYVMIYENGLVVDKNLGDRSDFDKSAAIENTESLTMNYIYPIGSMSFGDVAVSQINREIIDVCFAMGIAEDDFGDRRIYAVSTTSGAGSPGLPAEILYSTDTGKTWTAQNIDGVGASEAPLAIKVVSSYLVVIGSGAYYYASLNQKTGIPGTFTKVTTGFVAGKAPVDMFVLSPREVFFVGNGGYIYKAEDIPSGVTVVSAASLTSQNLLRIHGAGDTLLAVGASGTLLKSTNRGGNWFTTTSSPETGSIQAVAVVDKDIYWIGSSNGYVYYTINGGETWTTLSYPGLGSGQIFDIVFSAPSVGYISHATTTPTARLIATWNGGKNWSNGQYRIMNWPTFNRANRLAVPDTDDPGWKSNTLAVGGLAGDGLDGILFLGLTNKV